MSSAHLSRSDGRDDAKTVAGNRDAEEVALQIAIDTIPALVWTARSDGAAEFVNQRWLDYTGLSREQARGSGWAVAVHPEDIAMLVDRWSEIIASKEQGEVEARLRRFDGEYRWFLFRGAPLLDEQENVVSWYGTNTDIDDRKKAEEALHRTNAYLEHAQKLSHTGNVGFHVSDGKVFWSEETARIYGYDPEIEPTMQMVLERTHPDDVPLLKKVFSQAAEGWASFEFEHRLLMPDGSIKYIRNLAHSVKDEFGNEEVLGAVTDITEQHQARAAVEAALANVRKSEAEFRAMIEALPTHVWCALPDGSTEFQNQRWLDYVGLTPDEAQAGRWREAIHPDDVEQYMKRWLEIKTSQKAGEAEARFRRFDGTYHWFLMRVVPVRDERGEIVRWYGTNTDIENLKRAEMELRRSESILAEGEAMSDTGSGTWNLITGKMMWSAQNFRMLGLDPDNTEPSVELFLERVHPDEVAPLSEVIETETAARRSYSLDYRVVMADGSLKHFHTFMRPIVKASGEIEEYIGISHDVTSAKSAEKALRRSEQVARGQVEALVQCLDVLATAPGPEEFIVHMLSTMGQLLEARWVALWLLDEARDCMVVKAAIRGGIPVAADPDNPFIKAPSSWKDDLGLQELFRTRAPVVCEDIDTDKRVLNTIREFFKAHGTKKFVRLPTLVGGEVKGFIAIHHGERGPYRPDEIELAQALAHQAMLAVQIGQAATLEERNRMARDIHDTLAQGFTAVIIQLQAAEDAKARGLGAEVDKHLQRARQLARDSLNEARRSVRALRPQVLEDATFWNAMKGLVRNATAGTEFRTTFKLRGKARDLPQLWQEHLLHVGQEALTNTLRHAKATHFETQLCFTKNEVRLELKDDGRGFVLKERHDGSGLIGMRERAERIGGKLEVRSALGLGTTVTVLLALAQSSLK